LPVCKDLIELEILFGRLGLRAHVSIYPRCPNSPFFFLFLSFRSRPSALHLGGEELIALHRPFFNRRLCLMPSEARLFCNSAALGSILLDELFAGLQHRDFAISTGRSSFFTSPDGSPLSLAASTRSQSFVPVVGRRFGRGTGAGAAGEAGRRWRSCIACARHIRGRSRLGGTRCWFSLRFSSVSWRRSLCPAGLPSSIQVWRGLVDCRWYFAVRQAARHRPTPVSTPSRSLLHCISWMVFTYSMTRGGRTAGVGVSRWCPFPA